ncbi:PRP38 pre-mRNA processing factor 38 domain-containing protein B [Bulinus truncatus]|nr:PRP38 pre-mRNA processing factor 38 domain-containing protein B [Bulinus truncatus]
MAPSNALSTWGNDKTMNLNTLILTNIQSSPYFKVQLFELKTFHEVVDEIYYRVEHLEPWEKGSRKTAGQTGMCGGVRGVGAGGIVSSAYCLLFKLFTLKLTKKQVNNLITHGDSPYIRGLGFMYIRYTQTPSDLWDWYEPYLDDEEELDVKAGGGHVMTIGEMLRQWLVKLEWYSTLFPRIPVPVQKDIDQKLRTKPVTEGGYQGYGDQVPEEPQHIPDDQVSFGEAERAAISQRSRCGSHRDEHKNGSASYRASPKRYSPSRRRSPRRSPPRRHISPRQSPVQRSKDDFTRELEKERERQRREKKEHKRSKHSKHRSRSPEIRRSRSREKKHSRSKDKDRSSSHHRDKHSSSGRKERDESPPTKYKDSSSRHHREKDSSPNYKDRESSITRHEEKEISPRRRDSSPDYKDLERSPYQKDRHNPLGSPDREVSSRSSKEKDSSPHHSYQRDKEASSHRSKHHKKEEKRHKHKDRERKRSH